MLIELTHILGAYRDDVVLVGDHVGPKDVSEFDDTLGEEERVIQRRDAFERVNDLLRRTGVA